MPSQSFSFIKALAILFVVAVLGIVLLLKTTDFFADFFASVGLSRGLYEVSALVIGGWLALRAIFGRRK